jgi:competence protein CoiA
MKFAIVDDVKTEPSPKMCGICIHCEAEMVSKCGKVKVWHWAHKSKN